MMMMVIRRVGRNFGIMDVDRLDGGDGFTGMYIAPDSPHCMH